MKAIVTWWSHDEAVVVNDVAELDRVVDNVIQSQCKEYPTVLEIRVNGYLFNMAVGLVESFVQISSGSGLSPYRVAVFDKNAAEDDTFNFYLQGHHTEIRRRHILPSTFARELARSFVATGTIPDNVEWEEV